MSKNLNPSHQDYKQCAQRMFDTENDAQRVVIVGGEGIEIKANVVIPEPRETQVVVKEVQFERIEVPVIIKEIEIREVQVPVIVKEIQVVTVEKPVITTIYETIQVPVVVEKVVNVGFPPWAKAVLGAQVLCAVLQLISNFIK